MSKMLLTLAATGLIASVPALAEPREPKPPVSDTSADSPEAPKATRYCIKAEPATGSRISRQVCHTRDAWLQRGFDPLAPKGR